MQLRICSLGLISVGCPWSSPSVWDLVSLPSRPGLHSHPPQLQLSCVGILPRPSESPDTSHSLRSPPPFPLSREVSPPSKTPAGKSNSTLQHSPTPNPPRFALGASGSPSRVCVQPRVLPARPFSPDKRRQGLGLACLALPLCLHAPGRAQLTAALQIRSCTRLAPGWQAARGTSLPQPQPWNGSSKQQLGAEHLLKGAG